MPLINAQPHIDFLNACFEGREPQVIERILGSLENEEEVQRFLHVHLINGIQLCITAGHFELFQYFYQTLPEKYPSLQRVLTVDLKTHPERFIEALQVEQAETKPDAYNALFDAIVSSIGAARDTSTMYRSTLVAEPLIAQKLLYCHPELIGQYIQSSLHPDDLKLDLKKALLKLKYTQSTDRYKQIRDKVKSVLDLEYSAETPDGHTIEKCLAWIRLASEGDDLMAIVAAEDNVKKMCDKDEYKVALSNIRRGFLDINRAGVKHGNAFGLYYFKKRSRETEEEYQAVLETLRLKDMVYFYNAVLAKDWGFVKFLGDHGMNYELNLREAPVLRDAIMRRSCPHFILRQIWQALPMDPKETQVYFIKERCLRWLETLGLSLGEIDALLLEAMNKLSPDFLQSATSEVLQCYGFLLAVERYPEKYSAMVNKMLSGSPGTLLSLIVECSSKFNVASSQIHRAFALSFPRLSDATKKSFFNHPNFDLVSVLAHSGNGPTVSRMKRSAIIDGFLESMPENKKIPIKLLVEAVASTHINLVLKILSDNKEDILSDINASRGADGFIMFNSLFEAIVRTGNGRYDELFYENVSNALIQLLSDESCNKQNLSMLVINKPNIISFCMLNHRPIMAKYFLNFFIETDPKRNFFQKLFFTSNMQKISSQFPGDNVILDNLRVARKFIEYGMNVNFVNPDRNFTPLGALLLGIQNHGGVLSVEKCQEIEETLAFLIARGANINKALRSIEMPYTSALKAAIRAGDLAQMLLLMNARAQIDTSRVTDQNTADTLRNNQSISEIDTSVMKSWAVLSDRYPGWLTDEHINQTFSEIMKAVNAGRPSLFKRLWYTLIGKSNLIQEPEALRAARSQLKRLQRDPKTGFSQSGETLKGVMALVWHALHDADCNYDTNKDIPGLLIQALYDINHSYLDRPYGNQEACNHGYFNQLIFCAAKAQVPGMYVYQASARPKENPVLKILSPVEHYIDAPDESVLENEEAYQKWQDDNIRKIGIYKTSCHENPVVTDFKLTDAELEEMVCETILSLEDFKAEVKKRKPVVIETPEIRLKRWVDRIMETLNADVVSEEMKRFYGSDSRSVYEEMHALITLIAEHNKNTTAEVKLENDPNIQFFLDAFIEYLEVDMHFITLIQAAELKKAVNALFPELEPLELSEPVPPPIRLGETVPPTPIVTRTNSAQSLRLV